MAVAVCRTGVVGAVVDQVRGATLAAIVAVIGEHGGASNGPLRRARHIGHARIHTIHGNLRQQILDFHLRSNLIGRVAISQGHCDRPRGRAPLANTQGFDHFQHRPLDQVDGVGIGCRQRGIAVADGSDIQRQGLAANGGTVHFSFNDQPVAVTGQQVRGQGIPAAIGIGVGKQGGSAVRLTIAIGIREYRPGSDIRIDAAQTELVSIPAITGIGQGMREVNYPPWQGWLALRTDQLDAGHRLYQGFHQVGGDTLGLGQRRTAIIQTGPVTGRCLVLDDRSRRRRRRLDCHGSQQ